MQTALMVFAFVVLALGVVWVLAFHAASAWAWFAAAALAVGALGLGGALTPTAALVLLGVIGAATLIFAVKPIRRAIITRNVFGVYRKMLPQMSSTEREALEAGTVWWDGELFSGKPDWKKLLDVPAPALSAEERAFIDGPTEELCRMLDDWDITHHRMDLPPDVWQFIKDKGFLGMIIPKEFGGLGFSAKAHSEVVMKIATRSMSAAVSVMVPNSLGPGELLTHYGTVEQKRHYLPRLAKGLEIPCFALTSPEAGSDAASMPDVGIVCKGEYQGREVLGIRLTWEKRYITLGPIATLLGLAFKLYDPQRLLGDKEDVGITLALIPTNHKGVHIGRRHFPLNSAFMNGPNWGKDVFIPMEWVIGGRDMVGQGWRMLMECLAAGRSISLPAQSMAAAKLAARMSGAYARIRTQFKLAIGKFEGIEEPLARIGGNCYLIDATRTLTAHAVDLGERPAVLSAIAKYHMTERMRGVLNDAMDIHGGKGICMGPNNYLARGYQSIPIAITVEGANILTRSMIIFGQGAIRCHPFVLREMKAAADTDMRKALVEFDNALWGHFAFTFANAARALWFGLTGGKGAGVPGAPETRRFFQLMTRFSAAFALLADISMFVLGSSLKRKEKLSARLGDMLSLLYINSCVLKRYHDQGAKRDDLPLLQWAMYDGFFRLQVAFDGFLANFPNRTLAWIMRRLVFPKGLTLTSPSDKMGAAVAQLLMTPGEARERLTAGVFAPYEASDLCGKLDVTLDLTIKLEPVEQKIRQAEKSGVLKAKNIDELHAQALDKAVITRAEFDDLVRHRKLKREVIDVDHFPLDLSQPEVEALTGMTDGAERPTFKLAASM